MEVGLQNNLHQSHDGKIEIITEQSRAESE